MGIKRLIKTIKNHQYSNKKIYYKLLEIEKNVNTDINIIFKYITQGVELHPSYCCERVIINDYHDILVEGSNFPVWYYEHIHRYLFVKDFIKNEDIVLDIACGSGYGSKLIAQESKPKAVTGADISNEIIEFARRLNTNSIVNYVQADATKENSFEKEQFSKIISFETLEHVEEEQTKKMIYNYYNWLKPDGMLICSTPFETIAPLFRHGIKINQYHYKHYTDTEIKNILQETGFKDIKIFYQDIKNFHTEPNSNTPYLLILAKK